MERGGESGSSESSALGFYSELGLRRGEKGRIALESCGFQRNQVERGKVYGGATERLCRGILRVFLRQL